MLGTVQESDQDEKFDVKEPMSVAAYIVGALDFFAQEHCEEPCIIGE